MLSQQIENNLISSKSFTTFFKNQRIGLAVSGGIDSMVLLDTFCKISRKYNLKLYVMHYNHKWRKKSFMDAQLVRKYSEENKVFFLYKENEGKIVKDEETAREQRYSFFKACAKKLSLKVICTAHHKDDQVETVLFRLTRGTGPNGLLPIKEFLDFSHNTKIYRPFLSFTKEQIYKYAKKHRLPYIEDETNKDLKYKRNLIRRKILPLLRKVNEKAANNILLCSDLVYSQNVVVGNYFSELFKKLSLSKTQHFTMPLKISRKKFLQYDEYTQKAFTYWVLTFNNLIGNVSKINLILLTIKSKGIIELTKEHVLSVNDDCIMFENKKKSKPEIANSGLNESFVLNGRNKRIHLGGKSQLELKLFVGSFSKKIFFRDKEMIAYVDMSNYRNKKLNIRYRNAKDKFHPLGLQMAVKLKNYLINKKIPKQYRYNLPLLCFHNEVLWIPGYSLSENLKVKDKPTHILEIK